MFMKVIVSLILAIALVCPVAHPASAEPHQVSQGTEIHLTLLTPINSSKVQEGDAITAVTSQPEGKAVFAVQGTGVRECQFQDPGSEQPADPNPDDVAGDWPAAR
jgi:hypothetical protein